MSSVLAVSLVMFGVWLDSEGHMPTATPNAVLAEKLDEILQVMLAAQEAEKPVEVVEVAEVSPTPAPIKLFPVLITPPVVPNPPPVPVRSLTVGGVVHSHDEFIAANFTRRWEYRGSGTLREHLLSHGVSPDELSGMGQDEMVVVHSAIHEAEAGKPVRATVFRSTPTYSYQSNCPNGRCPTVRRRR